MGRVTDRPRGRTAAATKERPLCIIARYICVACCSICVDVMKIVVHFVAPRADTSYLQIRNVLWHVMIASCMVSCWILANWKIVQTKYFRGTTCFSILAVGVTVCIVPWFMYAVKLSRLHRIMLRDTFENTWRRAKVDKGKGVRKASHGDTAANIATATAMALALLCVFECVCACVSEWVCMREHFRDAIWWERRARERDTACLQYVVKLFACLNFALPSIPWSQG